MAIHLRPPVARRLMRPTRGLGSAPLPRRTGLRPPTWPCSGWSLPRFTPPAETGGIVTVALVLVSRRTGVTRHPALWSSDFPHVGPGRPGAARPSDRLAGRLILPLGEVAGGLRPGARGRVDLDELCEIATALDGLILDQ